ncbi:hypothetical protein FOHLNKBM_2116 [Methylobacterium longum]|nr:hypothetical protein FOHLNKBM_2116 [Methylobacterium longum]
MTFSPAGTATRGFFIQPNSSRRKDTVERMASVIVPVQSQEGYCYSLRHDSDGRAGVWED